MKTLAGPTLVLVCVLLILPALCAARPDHGGLDRQRLEVGRALIEVQADNWPSVLPYYTDDIEYHDPIVDIVGIDDMTAFLARLFENSPDLVTTIEDETVSGRIYSATWIMAGQFAGVPYSARGMSIIRFDPESAQVSYQRDYYTEGDIMASIPGLDQAIEGFRTYYRCAVDPTFDCPLMGAPGGMLHGFEPRGRALDLLAAPGAADLQDPQRAPSWIRQQQLEVGRALVAIDAENWPSLLRYYLPNYEYHDPIVDIHGRDTMAEFLGRLFSSGPAITTVIEEESLVRGVYTATWTMFGEFDGVPFSAPGMSIVKFHGWSRFAYYSRDYYTEGDIMANIPGLDEAVEGFRVFYRCAVDPTYDCPLGGPEAVVDADVAGRDGASAGKSDLPPAAFRLDQNVPNPFNPATEIAFTVPEGGASVSLRVYDLTGRLVRTLVDGHEPAGTRTVTWHGRDDRGQPLASGTYVYQLTAPAFSEVRTMVLLK